MKANTDIKIAGKYNIARRIGAGSFGEIFLAFDINSGEQFAVKLVFSSRGIQTNATPPATI